MARAISERTDALPALIEVFREHGFEGASLSLIGQRTGLGKGSLYNFFPGGKDEMAAAVLAEIDAWFEVNAFAPLRSDPDPARAIGRMLAAVEDYFHAGRRVCLVGAFALGDARDRFPAQVRGYFADWHAALTETLVRAGHDAQAAEELSEEALGAIQGGLVLARALDDPAHFQRVLTRLRRRLGAE